MAAEAQEREAKDDDSTTELAAYTSAIWNSPNGSKLNYRLRGPHALQANKTYPLILFLHGAGGRGDDNRGQLADAGVVRSFADQNLFDAQSTSRNCYVLAGQVPTEQQWVDVPWNTLDHEMPDVSNSMRTMLECLDALVADPKNQIDANRIYVIGLSMGGFGTWDAIQRRPDYFAAAVPICGGGDKRLAAKLSRLPIWAWHGDQDNVINPSRSRDMVAAIRSVATDDKNSIQYTEVAGCGHNVWVPALASQDLWDWLFRQSREPTDSK